MKTACTVSILRLMTSLLLIAITSSGVVGGQKEVVLDSNGQPVKANAPYYIRKPEDRAWISRSGYSILAPLSCPLRVVLSAGVFAETPPPPVIFELASSDGVVRVSTELNIMFSRRSICPESEYWKVANSPSPIKEVVLSRSKSRNESTFSIQKFDSGSYKFGFGRADKPTDIGLDGISLGLWRLILSNGSSFGVSFVPAS